MAEVTPDPIQEQMRRLQWQAEMLQEQVDTLQLTLAWLLERQTGDDVFRFLCRQANELDGDPRYAVSIQTLDDLREDFSVLRARRESAPSSGPA